MKKFLILILIFGSIILPAFGFNPNKRSAVFSYNITLKDLPRDTKEVRIWVPYPAENEFQKVTQIELTKGWLRSVSKDPKYANKILYYVVKDPKSPAINISQKYKITRYEFRNALTNNANKNIGRRLPAVYLKSNKFIKITPETKRIAKEIAVEKEGSVSKARAIYEYILSNYTYDKRIPGWGSGDVDRFCRFKSGNCTDFHSLFISLANYLGIPAKFVIGFSLPKNNKDTIKSYHCWLEFYEPNSGWIPLDIAEASKDKSKYSYNFGSVDENRVEFAHGRDIVLAPANNSGNLNFFIYPLVEINGKIYENVDVEFEFQDLT